MRDVRRSPRRSRRLATCLALLVVACSKAPTSPTPRTTAASPAAAAAPAASDWRYNRPPAGAPGKLLYPEPEQALLSNGLDVYVVRRPAGVVSMALVARTEPLPARRSGLHAVTVRMLTEGTLEHPGLALAEAVESLGSTLDSDAGRDAVSVSLEILRSDAPRALSLLAEVVQRPALDQAVFKRVQKEWLDGLRAERQNPSRLAALVGLRRLLGPVYGAPVRGTAEDVRSFEISDVRADHRQVFVPNRSALIVVGDVTLGELRADVERLFGSWQATPPPELPTIALPKPPQKPRIVVVDRPGAVQTALFAAQLFPKRSDPGYVARQLLNSILGGLFTSRLNRNLREEHAYTYGAGSAAVATRYWGALVASTSVKTEVSVDALAQLMKEVRGFSDGKGGHPVTADELERAKADYLATLGAHLEHTSRVLSDATTQFVYNLPRDYFSTFSDRLASADRAKVMAQADRFLHPDEFVIVAVGDRAKLEGPLAQKGYQWEVADSELLR